MVWGHKVRRRVSKKYLSLLLVGSISIYYFFLFMYYHLNKPIKVELVNNVNVILQQPKQHQDFKKIHDLQDNVGDKPQPLMGAPKVKKAPEELPQMLENEYKPEDKSQLKQNVQYMEKILNKMEKSIKKDDAQSASDFAKLPKPAQMLSQLKGPVEMKSSKMISRFKTLKMLIISRENAGFPVIAQFLTQKNSFFVHGEPPPKLDVVTNLFNCILMPEMVLNFSQLIKNDFGKTPYLSNDCLLDSEAVCTDPLSYEHKCDTAQHQVIRSKHFSLEFAGELLESTEDIRIIYLVRDPRGIFKDSKQKPKKLCLELSKDWDRGLDLVSKYPNRVQLVRYETIAVSPVSEFNGLLKQWGIELKEAGQVDVVEDIEAWSERKNSPAKVNSWKTGLTSSELKMIESDCGETLSKMEYQLLGTVL